MQVKTINKIIKNKMNEWVESISDIQLQKQLRENVVVSGGCIASMFLKEDVNDFDVYIQDVKVLEKIANYYCKPLLIDVVTSENKMQFIEDKEQYELYLSNEEYVANKEQRMIYRVSEGMVSPIISDFNLFHISEEDKDKLKNYSPLFITPNAISLKGDVQIITRFSGTIEEIHSNYDFVHATNYWTFQDGLVTNKKALESLLTRRLFYIGSKYPVTSIMRMKKFINRKWTISAGQILKIAMQVSELDLNDFSTFEDQIIGVDIAYFSTLLDVLASMKPKKRKFTYIYEIIDKFFEGYDS